jgi:hypothetical protein
VVQGLGRLARGTNARRDRVVTVALSMDATAGGGENVAVVGVAVRGVPMTPQQPTLFDMPRRIWSQARLLAQVELPADVERAITAESARRGVPWMMVYREWAKEGRV